MSWIVFAIFGILLMGLAASIFQSSGMSDEALEMIYAIAGVGRDKAQENGSVPQLVSVDQWCDGVVECETVSYRIIMCRPTHIRRGPGFQHDIIGLAKPPQEFLSFWRHPNGWYCIAKDEWIRGDELNIKIEETASGSVFSANELREMIGLPKVDAEPFQDSLNDVRQRLDELRASDDKKKCDHCRQVQPDDWTRNYCRYCGAPLGRR